MLIGEFHYKVGAKKRIAIPKKLREDLGGKVVVTRGYEDCLVVVGSSQWNALMSEIVSGPFTAKAVRDSSRFLIGGAVEIEPDGQGRFVLPDHLLEHAGIQDEVIFLGLMNWVEIWDADKWAERKDYVRTKGAEIAEDLRRITSVSK